MVYVCESGTTCDEICLVLLSFVFKSYDPRIADREKGG